MGWRRGLSGDSQEQSRVLLHSVMFKWVLVEPALQIGGWSAWAGHLLLADYWTCT